MVTALHRKNNEMPRDKLRSNYVYLATLVSHGVLKHCRLLDLPLGFKSFVYHQGKALK